MSDKIDRGAATEDDVQRFVEHAFGEDFVFRSPFHERGGKQKETTDVLAAFDDVAVPIQVKAQAYNADDSPRAESASWLRKNLQKAVAQVNGATRTLKGEGVVRLRNVRRGSLDFDRSKYHYFYGVVVLNHVSQPFLAEEVVPELAASPFPIHVFSFVDFLEIARVLDTPVDLTGYLEMRADVLVPTMNPKVHAERPAFDYYIDHFEKLATFRASQHGEAIPSERFTPYGDALRQISRGTLPNQSDSYYIDRIIDEAHKVDESLSGATTREGEVVKSDYAIIAEYLSGLVRSRRAVFGHGFRDAIDRAAQQREPAFWHASTKARDECILFMASSLAQNERVERRRQLSGFLRMLRAARGVRQAFGIATEAGHESGRSYDFILEEQDPEDLKRDPDYEQLKQFGETLFPDKPSAA